MKFKLFTLDSDQKQLLLDISALCGIKQELVVDVWQYTLFTIFLKILENKDKKVNIIKIPYLGNALLKETDEGFETFFSVNQNFIDIVKKIKKGDDSGLVEYFQQEFLEKLLTNME